jgi:hypothetical protein
MHSSEKLGSSGLIPGFWLQTQLDLGPLVRFSVPTRFVVPQRRYKGGAKATVTMRI